MRWRLRPSLTHGRVRSLRVLVAAFNPALRPLGEVCERKVFSAGVRFRLRHGGKIVSGVIFGVGDDYPGRPGETLDVAYRLTENQWNGNTSVELKIADVRQAK